MGKIKKGKNLAEQRLQKTGGAQHILVHSMRAMCNLKALWGSTLCSLGLIPEQSSD